MLSPKADLFEVDACRPLQAVGSGPGASRFAAAARYAVIAVLALTLLPGCPIGPPSGKVPVPDPVNLLLPTRMRIHPFTDVISGPDGVKRVEVRIEAIDSFGDATKMFGEFRFELYTVKAMSVDPKGRLIETWDVPIMDGKSNLAHWDGITRTYVFKLDWDTPLPGNGPLVIRAVFSSPFTPRYTAERTLEPN